MNVYDFDETIFYGDSEKRFLFFLYNRKGYGLWKINYRIARVLFRTRILNKTKAREMEYRVLRVIDKKEDLSALLEEFWDKNEQYMMPWYAAVKKPDDVICSGTPRFVLEPIVRRLCIGGLVATDMDPRTARVNGKYAVAEEKKEAFCRAYDPAAIDTFYSDAYSDHFLADVAPHAAVIYGDQQQMEWNEFFRLHPEKRVIPYRR